MRHSTIKIFCSCTVLSTFLFAFTDANMTDYMQSNSNETVVIAGSEEHQEIWKTRVRAVSGG